KQLVGVVEYLKESNGPHKPVISGAFSSDDVNEEEGPAILIVDDLGVITYQLKVLLSQFGLEIDCSQEIYDAISKFKKRKYKYVIMDLFIPTDREGFIFLTELKKMSAMYNTETVIGVITASPRKEIEQQCRVRGADFFLEKNNDWQSQLCQIMHELIGDPEEEDF
ncbi:MAG: response regulator, partial [bacterium]|nr:response regulator [bacterium]